MSKNNIKNILYVAGLLLVVGGLFYWPIISDPKREEKQAAIEAAKPLIAKWKAAGINCLSGHSAIAGAGQHIHQQVMITVDGAPETLVGDIGIVSGCMAEIHVHSGEGENNLLHVESLLRSKKMTLGQFFVVYGKPLIREGYKLEVTANDEAVSDPTNLVLIDKQVIKMTYTSAAK